MKRHARLSATASAALAASTTAFAASATAAIAAAAANSMSVSSRNRRGQANKDNDHEVKIVTKQQLRFDTWEYMDERRLHIGACSIYHHVPEFKDTAKVLALLTHTREYRRAQHVQVNNDRALSFLKLPIVLAEKTLYMPGTRDANGLCMKFAVQSGTSVAQKCKMFEDENMKKHWVSLTLQHKIKLDMVVIGSVVVSRNGYRVGRGNGFADLGIGVLIEAGAVTPKTVIMTIVHDAQVVDTMPANLFQPHDIPIDIIVTPSEVIRVTNRLPRPTGIYWNILADRHLQIMPVLQTLKHRSENCAKEKENVVRQVNERRIPIKCVALEREVVVVGRAGIAGSDQPLPFKPRGEHSKRAIDFTMEVFNIPAEVRVKDLKAQLRSMECAPSHISWQVNNGKCLLYYNNRSAFTMADNNDILRKLENLTITLGKRNGTGRTVKLSTELMKPCGHRSYAHAGAGADSRDPRQRCTHKSRTTDGESRDSSPKCLAQSKSHHCATQTTKVEK